MTTSAPDSTARSALSEESLRQTSTNMTVSSFFANGGTCTVHVQVAPSLHAPIIIRAACPNFTPDYSLCFTTAKEFWRYVLREMQPTIWAQRHFDWVCRNRRYVMTYYEDGTYELVAENPLIHRL